MRPQTPVQIVPIGYVRGGRQDVRDDDWADNKSVIELSDAFLPEALFGLSDFSHAEIVFYFDRVADEKIETSARHPRGNPNWPLVGIFAQRGKNRPNRIGLCICSILKVEGTRIEVQGLDAIDGTPVLDIKPVFTSFLPRDPVREPQWVQELMTDYWVKPIGSLKTQG